MLDVGKVTGKLEAKQLKWYDPIQRMRKERPTKHAVEAKRTRNRRRR